VPAFQQPNDPKSKHYACFYNYV